MLSCEELRRLKLIDPRRMTPEMHRHLAECPPCAEFAQSVDVIEHRVEQTLEVAPPPSLAQRIVRRHAPEAAGWFAGGWWSFRWRHAMAAALVLALGAVLLIGPGTQRDALLLAVLEHVLHEEAEELKSASVSRDPAAIARILADSGLVARPGVIEAVHIGDCALRDVPGTEGSAHLVLVTAHGKASLLLWPGRPVDRSLQLTKGSLAVLLQPAAKGSMAIVADSAERAERVLQLLL
jgi:hypothetical protein